MNNRFEGSAGRIEVQGQRDAIAMPWRWWTSARGEGSSSCSSSGCYRRPGTAAAASSTLPLVHQAPGVAFGDLRRQWMAAWVHFLEASKKSVWAAVEAKIFVARAEWSHGPNRPRRAQAVSSVDDMKQAADIARRPGHFVQAIFWLSFEIVERVGAQRQPNRPGKAARSRRGGIRLPERRPMLLFVAILRVAAAKERLFVLPQRSRAVSSAPVWRSAAGQSPSSCSPCGPCRATASRRHCVRLRVGPAACVSSGSRRKAI